MKRSQLKRISPKKVQELIDSGQSIPASSFEVAKKLGKKTRKKFTSVKTYHKGVLHGSKRQVLVYQNYELVQMAGEIEFLEAEVDYTLDCPGGQVGGHRVDLQMFVPAKKHWQIFNVKPDYEDSADDLSKWKKRHWEKQYPTLPHPETEVLYPTRYDFYYADEYGGRVFFNEKELLDNIGG